MHSLTPQPESALSEDNSTAGDKPGWGRRVGLLAGPLVAVACYCALPDQFENIDGEPIVFSAAGRATLLVMIWMAIWWLTEAVDISATALLPLVMFPVLDVADFKSTAAPYADPLIFLFMGGFLLALSMQRWHLDRRIALLTLRAVGTKPVNMVAGFMLVTATLSAFVSNTATTAMMLPIAISVVALVRQPADDSELLSADSAGVGNNFAICLMLGIAYSASVGGLTTIIGTPPNVFLVGFLKNSIAPEYRMEMSFARWLLIGLPIAIVFLPAIWILLTRIVFPIRLQEIPGGKALIETGFRQLGSMSRGEWATFLVFMATASAWITRPLLTQFELGAGADVWRPLAGLTDAGIAMLGAMVLFVIPSGTRQQRFVMDWKIAEQLPWGILILFGGGLSLAGAIQANGVAEFIGSQTRFIAGIPEFWLVLIVSAGVILLTELTSNIATTATLLPIMAAMSPGLDVHPYLLIFPTAVAASCAFMLPVATPPNAIVFASGEITIRQMMKAGVWLNLIAVLLVTLLTFAVIKPVLGI